LLQQLKNRDISFRCAGRAGLFQQPEAQLLGQTYAWLCDADWKSDPYGQSAPVDIDQLIAALRSVFPSAESKKELKGLFEDWKNSVPANTSPVNLVRDYYYLLNKLGVRDWDLNDPVVANRMGTLARFSQLLADIEHVTRRARYVADESGEKYRGGTDRGIHFYRRLFNYLQFYALDAYAEFEGEESYDQDAVDILTIHQAKGLEWPVVFMPSLVDGRFPSKYAGKPQNWLVPERVFKKSTRQRYEGSNADERRLFYVGMTRARDVLYLSRFEKKTNKFRISPYLLEVAGTEPPLRDSLPIPKFYTPPVHSPDELPTVSFSDLAYYDQCPLRYRLSSLLRFQPQLATELGYGRAIHHILRHVAELTKAKRKLPTNQEIEAIFEEHFYLPFANRPLFENLLDRAHKLIQKYMTTYGDDMLRVWETERPFELHLGKANVTGRADVILDREGGSINNLAIVDYKTANDTKGDDLYAFQLQIYAAAGRGEGLNVVAARVHHLKDVRREEIPIDTVHIRTARAKAEALVLGIVEREFPHRPNKQKCKSCDVRAICKHADCSQYDL
jgi:DNA helicase-2/ATP-dependent DNA helicase PcrA